VKRRSIWPLVGFGLVSVTRDFGSLNALCETSKYKTNKT
jgi:hypothetical protein